MESLATKSEVLLRKLLATADYLAWLLLDPSKFAIIKKDTIKKVLIIHLGAIGEVLASTPIIPALKNSLKAEIVYMVAPGKQMLLENNPNVDKVLVYPDDFWKTVEILKKEKFDIAFIIYPSSQKLTLACLFAGIRYRIGGFKGVRDGINLFFTRKMLDFREKHAVQCNLDIIRTIGLDNKAPKLELYVSKKDQDNIDKILKKLKIKDYVIMHPGSSFMTQLKYPSRFWPLERYARVADFIAENYNVKILITGGIGEKKFAEEIIRKAKNKKAIINLSEELELGQISALLSKAKLMIVTSTGVAHIASALGTNMVHLSGPDGPHWHPWAQKGKCKIIQHNEVCTGCNKVFCRKKTQECMLAITPEEVILAAEHFLGKRK